MFGIVSDFLADLLNNFITGLAEVFGDIMADWINAAFFIEEHNWSPILSAERISSAFWIMYGVAAAILVLKFVQKGFMVYVLWRDGDADNDPGNMVMGAVLALVVTIAFPPLYQIFANTVKYIGGQVLGAFTEPDYSSDPLAAISALTSGGFVLLLEAIAFVFTWVILLFKMMMRSVEMFVYRIGFPLAAIGLVNSDGGAFKSYAQLLFKQAVYMLVQALLASIGIAVSATNLIGGIVILICAVKAPRFLSQFFPTVGGGGIGGAVSTVATLARLVVAA